MWNWTCQSLRRSSSVFLANVAPESRAYQQIVRTNSNHWIRPTYRYLHSEPIPPEIFNQPPTSTISPVF